MSGDSNLCREIVNVNHQIRRPNNPLEQIVYSIRTNCLVLNKTKQVLENPVPQMLSDFDGFADFLDC